MRVLFMISIEPAPMLEDKEKWSLVFHDFVAKCLTKEPRVRPTAAEMLKHKFVERCKCGATAMLPKIEKARQVRALMAQEAQNLPPDEPELDATMSSKLNEDYGDTVPSKPLVQVTDEVFATSTLKKQHMLEDIEEGDFGTVVVHEIDKTTLQSQRSNYVKESSSLVGHAEISGTGGKSADTRVDGAGGVASNNKVVGKSHHFTQTIQGSSAKNPTNISQGQIGGGRDTSSGTLKSETVSKKAFALQDKLWSIYAAGNTVPIPFLRATDISPIALLSDNVLGATQHDNKGTAAVEALQELFTGDGQSKKGRRGQNEIPLPPNVYQRLTSSSTLLNLAQALAYHKTCYEEMPLQELQVTQEEQTIQNLCDTLRTILRL